MKLSKAQLKQRTEAGRQRGLAWRKFPKELRTKRAKAGAKQKWVNYRAKNPHKH